MSVINMRYIETSFVLCLMTKKPLAFYEPAKAMFDDITNRGFQTAISPITIFEVIGTLRRRENWTREKIIREFSKFMGNLNPLMLNLEDGNILNEAFTVWRKYDEDMFFDCLHYAIMKAYKISEIYSIDKDFDLFPAVNKVVGES